MSTSTMISARTPRLSCASVVRRPLGRFVIDEAGLALHLLRKRLERRFERVELTLLLVDDLRQLVELVLLLGGLELELYDAAFHGGRLSRRGAAAPSVLVPRV